MTSTTVTVVWIIHQQALVLESGLLYKYLKHVYLESYHVIRKNDKKTEKHIICSYE